MSKIADYFFFQGKHVCPRSLCFTFDNVFRRLIHNPDKILQPYIRQGDNILDVGPGIGYFTIPMAQMAGEGAQVIAADIQETMLAAIKKRALKRGMEKRITLHLSTPASLGVEGKVDFILAFWMAHEVPDKLRFFGELHSLLKDEGKFLMVEPKIHVSKSQFVQTLQIAQRAGFTPVESPQIALSMSVLLVKTKS
jgi:Cyclopropane fatty acid synthase and related methyltransferases